MTFADRLSELGRALARLDEALAFAPTGAPGRDLPPPTDVQRGPLLPADIVRDAAIQRFEFSFELAWKALAAWLVEGLSPAPTSPRAVIREAYRQRLITDEARWITLLLDRNLTSHTYREATAQEVFARLPEHAALLRDLFDALSARGQG